MTKRIPWDYLLSRRTGWLPSPHTTLSLSKTPHSVVDCQTANSMLNRACFPSLIRAKDPFPLKRKRANSFPYISKDCVYLCACCSKEEASPPRHSYHAWFPDWWEASDWSDTNRAWGTWPQRTDYGAWTIQSRSSRPSWLAGKIGHTTNIVRTANVNPERRSELNSSLGVLKSQVAKSRKDYAYRRSRHKTLLLYICSWPFTTGTALHYLEYTSDKRTWLQKAWRMEVLLPRRGH
jgi:hypothetical protein